MGQVDEAAQIAEVMARIAATYAEDSTTPKDRVFIPLLVEREVRTVLAHRQTSLTWTT